MMVVVVGMSLVWPRGFYLQLSCLRGASRRSCSCEGRNANASGGDTTCERSIVWGIALEFAAGRRCLDKRHEVIGLRRESGGWR